MLCAHARAYHTNAVLTRPCFVLKEYFTLNKLAYVYITLLSFYALAYVTEESVALFQAATDEHWGADCSIMMETVSVYEFERHFQVARITTFRTDGLLYAPFEVVVAEKTGNIQDCIEITQRPKVSSHGVVHAIELLLPLSRRLRIFSGRGALSSAWRRGGTSPAPAATKGHFAPLSICRNQ
jgi:hypothetical protein